jgi:hypothetical protein
MHLPCITSKTDLPAVQALANWIVLGESLYFFGNGHSHVTPLFLRAVETLSCFIPEQLKLFVLCLDLGVTSEGSEWSKNTSKFLALFLLSGKFKIFAL